jgi:transcription initiation factor TFIID subunit 4
VYTTSQAQIVTTPVATTTTNAVPALTTHHLTAQQHQQIQQLQQSSHNSGQTVVLTNTTAPTLAVQQPQAQQVVQQQATPTPANRSSLDNSKEKCRKFLTNLIELSKREPKPVERNVRTLIQELVDARVEPEEFCERLERLLNASPQPCLIGFLKVRCQTMLPTT